jgi:hypothetical protein
VNALETKRNVIRLMKTASMIAAVTMRLKPLALRRVIKAVNSLRMRVSLIHGRKEVFDSAAARKKLKAAHTAILRMLLSVL